MSAVTFAGDDAGDDAAAWRRAATKILRKGDRDERRGLLRQIAAQADRATAFEVALDAVSEVADEAADAAEERASQGEKLFKYYAKYVLRAELPRERYTEYRVLEIDNERQGENLVALRAEVDRFEKAARTASDQVQGLDEAAALELTESLRSRVARTRDSDAKALLVGCLRGEVIDLAASDLHDWANDTSDRALSTAALATLRTRPEAIDATRLAPILESPDPVVRRHLFRTLGARGDMASLDVLVAATEREVGVPAIEVTSILRRVTGQPMGQSADAWKLWWGVQRDTWTRAAANDIADADFARTERSRYFGLSLHSARVLFVIDRSLSMDWPITHDGVSRLSAKDLLAERKFDVAKRELLGAISSLDETTSFNIIAYGTTLDHFRPRLVPASERNLGQAKRYVEKLDLEGSTNLSGAMLEAMEVTRPGANVRDEDIADTLVVLSDGEPNCGPIASPDHVLDELRWVDPERMVTIHTVFLGVAGDASFMRKLAEQSGGLFVHHKR